MRTFTEKLYTFACRFLQVFCLLLTAVLFLGAFLSTCYSLDMTSQAVLTAWDNPLFNLLSIGFLLGVFTVAARFFAKKHVTLLTILVLVWYLLLGAVLILFGKTVPAADALSVYSIAESLANGDTSVIHPTASYLSYYPQQIGLTAFFEILFRLYHLLPLDLPAYHFFKCLYVVLAGIIILYQKKTIHLLWENDTTDCFYLLLAGVNLPFLMYTSFVYGEIPSFAAVSVGLYYLAKLWKDSSLSAKKQFGCAAAVLVCLTTGVMLRKNNLILIIAVLIVVFFEWIKNRRHLLLLWCVLCTACCFTILPLTQTYYEHRAENTLRSGVTATSYIAMGMQESSRANGWYNGFNFNTYHNAGMDTLAANTISKEAIYERLDYFRENPAYAAGFYLEKHLSQWADGTYASRQATLATYGGRTSFFLSLYEGKGSHFWIAYCNQYQNLLYLGAFFFVLTAFRKKLNALPIYLGLVVVIGGFLFHIFWEANSRYIFLYSLLLMPYAARGLTELAQHICRRIPKLTDFME